jgi:hypothetical protein
VGSTLELRDNVIYGEIIFVSYGEIGQGCVLSKHTISTETEWVIITNNSINLNQMEAKLI